MTTIHPEAPQGWTTDLPTAPGDYLCNPFSGTQMLCMRICHMGGRLWWTGILTPGAATLEPLEPAGAIGTHRWYGPIIDPYAAIPAPPEAPEESPLIGGRRPRPDKPPPRPQRRKLRTLKDLENDE